MDTLLAVMFIIAVFLVAGAFAYLLGKIKALKADLRVAKASIQQVEQHQNTPYMVMQVPLGPARAPVSAKIIEIEKELDTITSQLEFTDKAKPLKSSERQALENRYDVLISQMVDHFIREADRTVLSSLSGDKK